MVLQSSGNTIYFSQLQSEFGGSNPTYLSEYFNVSNYVFNVSGIPYSGSNIRLSMFYDKSKSIDNVSTFPTIISKSIPATFTKNGTNYYYCIFSSITGTNNITFPSNITGQILIVGGGGGGGGGFCGGGGGGGNVYYNDSYNFLANTTYTITIGTGGIGAPPWTSSGIIGTTGNTTTIKIGSTTVLSAGGGTGGRTPYGNPYLLDGGNTSSTVIINGSTQTNNYVGQPGKNDGSSNYSGGGGAGAGGNAGPSGNTSGIGGNGFLSSITGTSIYYAGGGGGESYLSYQLTSNGLGQNNYGGGGRGGKPNNVKGDNGRSGCVIIAFTFP